MKSTQPYVHVILINDNVQDIALNRTQGGGQTHGELRKKSRPRWPKSIKSKFNENSLPYQSKKNADKSKKLGFFRNTLQHVPEKCKLFALSVSCLAALFSIKQPV